MSDGEVPDSFGRAVDALWHQFRPLVLGRILAVEGYARRPSLRGVDVWPADLEAALGAAHQLSGSLGTYGYARAGDIARRIEQELNEEAPHNGTLLAMVLELRAAIADGKSPR